MSETRRAAIPFVVGALVAMCGGGLLLGVLSIDWIATSRARDALVESGLVCDERLAVDVDFSMSTATLAPTRCQLVRVSYADALELPEGATVTLSGLRPTNVHVTLARVFLSEEEAPSISLGPMGPLGAVEGVESRLTSTGRAAAEIAAHAPPPMDIDRVELVRGTSAAVTLETVSVSGDGPLRVSIGRAELAELSLPLAVEASGELRNITGTATPSSSELEGDLVLSGRLPVFGSLAHEVHLVLRGSRLDTDEPTFELSTR